MENLQGVNWLIKVALIFNLVTFAYIYADKEPNNYRISAANANSISTFTLTETELLGLLSPQGRAIYLNLSSEGKALAIQLASQDSYQDKDLAVKEAQKRISGRYSYFNH